MNNHSSFLENSGEVSFSPVALCLLTRLFPAWWVCYVLPGPTCSGGYTAHRRAPVGPHERASGLVARLGPASAEGLTGLLTLQQVRHDDLHQGCETASDPPSTLDAAEAEALVAAAQELLRAHSPEMP